MTDMIAKDGVEAETVEAVKSLSGKYKYGFSTDVEIEYAPLGLSEDIVRLISEKNDEPEWMLEWRLQAFERWKQMKEPDLCKPVLARGLTPRLIESLK